LELKRTGEKDPHDILDGSTPIQFCVWFNDSIFFEERQEE